MWPCREVTTAEQYGYGRSGPRCSSSSTYAATDSCSSPVSRAHQCSNSSVYSTSHCIGNIPYRDYSVKGMTWSLCCEGRVGEGGQPMVIGRTRPTKHNGPLLKSGPLFLVPRVHRTRAVRICNLMEQSLRGGSHSYETPGD